MRRIVIIVCLLASLTVVGTVGFRVIEGWGWLDSLYMTIITVTTVGYETQAPLSDQGKLFVIFYLVSFLGIFTYSAFQLVQLIVSAEMRSLWETRRMEKVISRMDDHYIVCGAGRMGRTICQNLEERGRPFVVIDRDVELNALPPEQRSWLFIVGDATDDRVLQKAGVERARSLSSVLPTDADNLYVVLSARLLSEDLQIVARASDEKAARKMQQAGASRVVSPYRTGALKMARFMVSPNIEDFLEIADRRGQELELVEIQISADSPYVGKQLAQTNLRDKGVMIIGIRRAGGERLMPPPGSATIETGDCLFAFGSVDAVNSMVAESETGD